MTSFTAAPPCKKNARRRAPSRARYVSLQRWMDVNRADGYYFPLCAGRSSRVLVDSATVEIPTRLVLAPMAGVSVQAFRRQGRRYGAGLVCSEMVSCAGLHHRNERTLGYLRIVGRRAAAGGPDLRLRAG